MILRGSYKPDSFIDIVVRYVSGKEPRWKITKEGFSQVVYIGAGYWRAGLVEDETGLIGIRLMNPDRTFEEIETVERAISILGRLEWTSQS